LGPVVTVPPFGVGVTVDPGGGVGCVCAKTPAPAHSANPNANEATVFINEFCMAILLKKLV
jgi:hypothetical protein